MHFPQMLQATNFVGCFVYFCCIVNAVLYHHHLSESTEYGEQIGILELYEPGKATGKLSVKRGKVRIEFILFWDGTETSTYKCRHRYL
jgi:hypothetical protein